MEKTNLWVGLEKRRHPRINVVIPAQYQMLKQALDEDRHRTTGPEIKTVTENLSLGGAMIVTHTEIPVGGLLKLELQSSDGNFVEAQAKAVRITSSKTGHKYYVGLQFVLADEKEVKMLLEKLITEYSTAEKKMKL